MSSESSLRGAANFVFDLDSQKGVMHLLSSIRVSDLVSDKKNELRDLVLLYANGGKDQSVKITLTQKIKDYGVKPLPVKPEESPKPELSFGAYRPSPTIDIPKPKQVDVKKEVFEEVKSASVKPQTQVPGVSKTVKVNKQERSSYTPPDEVSVELVSQPKPVPATEVKIASEPPVETQTLEAQPVTQTVQSFDPEINLRRIKEIKALVNERIGNPVNLVDINNEVGREYMAALLDAMKKINSGSSSMSAMRRLEDAYKLVGEAIDKHTESKVAAPTEVTPPTTPSSEPVASENFPEQPVLESTAEPEPVPEPEVRSDLPPLQVETPQSKPLPTTPTIPKVSQHEPPADLPVVPQVEKKPVPSPDLEEETEDRSDNEKEEGPYKTESRFAPKEPVQSNWGEETEIAKVPESAIDEKVKSLADADDKPRDLNEIPKASSVDTSSVSGDPLYTKEIDKHLNDLLADWSLFKKSGLFGTGPKGVNHPLFKKISGLQIPMLLAGRFEGATQDIKQSITDYMNGWRYEQGIVYHQGEDFEHYLRRVIKHILDLQNKP